VLVDFDHLVQVLICYLRVFRQLVNHRTQSGSGIKANRTRHLFNQLLKRVSLTLKHLHVLHEVNNRLLILQNELRLSSSQLLAPIRNRRVTAFLDLETQLSFGLLRIHLILLLNLLGLLNLKLVPHHQLKLVVNILVVSLLLLDLLDLFPDICNQPLVLSPPSFCQILHLHNLLDVNLLQLNN